jgi:hypothetical protein
MRVTRGRSIVWRTLANLVAFLKERTELDQGLGSDLGFLSLFLQTSVKCKQCRMRWRSTSTSSQKTKGLPIKNSTQSKQRPKRNRNNRHTRTRLLNRCRSRTPPRHAPKQKQHPDTRHDPFGDGRAGLMRSRLVQSVYPRRAQCACSDDAA